MHTGQAKEVLRRLGLDDVDDVVVGNAPEQTPGLVHYGDRDQVVFRDQPRDLLLVFGGMHADDVPLHDVADPAPALGQDQLAQPHDSHQPLPGVDHVDGVEVAHLAPAVANGDDRFVGGEVLRDAHQLGRHHPAGRLLVVAHQRGDLARLFRLDPLQDLTSVLARQLGENVRGVVELQVAEELVDVGVLDALDQGRPGALAHFGQGLGAKIGGNAAEEGDPFVGIERVDDLGEVGRVELGDEIVHGRRRGSGLRRRTEPGHHLLRIDVFGHAVTAAREGSAIFPEA